jgi:hypothetical protein
LAVCMVLNFGWRMGVVAGPLPNALDRNHGQRASDTKFVFNDGSIAAAWEEDKLWQQWEGDRNRLAGLVISFVVTTGKMTARKGSRKNIPVATLHQIVVPDPIVIEDNEVQRVSLELAVLVLTYCRTANLTEGGRLFQARADVMEGEPPQADRKRVNAIIRALATVQGIPKHVKVSAKSGRNGEATGARLQNRLPNGWKPGSVVPSRVYARQAANGGSAVADGGRMTRAAADAVDPKEMSHVYTGSAGLEPAQLAAVEALTKAAGVNNATHAMTRSRSKGRK